MNNGDEQAMRERHLAGFRQARERLLAARAYWGNVELPKATATRMIAELDEQLEINASLSAVAEQRLATLVGQSRP